MKIILRGYFFDKNLLDEKKANCGKYLFRQIPHLFAGMTFSILKRPGVVPHTYNIWWRWRWLVSWFVKSKTKGAAYVKPQKSPSIQEISYTGKKQ